MRLFVLAFLCLVGCNRDSETSLTVQDDLGRTVALNPSPARIVSLAPNVTELIFAAGGGSKLVGVTTADDYPPEVKTITRFSALPVDFEAIVALNPDLVVASDQVNSPKDAATLADLAIPVFFVSIQHLDDVMRVIRLLGTLAGTEHTASLMADSLTQSIEELRLLTQEIPDRPSTLFLVSDVTLYSFGKGSYMHEVIQLSGGTSVTTDMTTRAPVLTDEFVLARQPDIIVGPFGHEYAPMDLLTHHPAWDALNAVIAGRVYSVEGSYFLRPGPRLIDGVWQLARIMHPEHVP